MAKRRGRPRSVAQGSQVPGGRGTSTVEADASRVGRRGESFTEDLGRLLGTAERKATKWLSQRQEVGRQLTELRDKATQLLSQLGLTGVSPNSRAGGRRRGRRPASAVEAPARRGRPPGKKKRTMSPEARERIAAAQRRRWAKVKRERRRLETL